MMKNRLIFVVAVIAQLMLVCGSGLGAVSAVEYPEGFYEWSFDTGMYSDDGKTVYDSTGKNNAVMKSGKTVPVFSNGVVRLNNSAFYLLEKPIVLAQDKNWRVEWKGKMEAGTTYSCQIILGNESAEQYVMYGSNKIFFGNKSKERAELACDKNTVAYKDTAYVIEGDGDRHVRLTYHVSGADAPVVGEWIEYPAAVGDITVSALFGSYQNILYKGTVDYVRVWEEYPDDLIEDSDLSISTEFKILDENGNEVFGTKDDIGKDCFYLTGKIKNESRKATDMVNCILALYDASGKMTDIASSAVKLSGKGEKEFEISDGICLKKSAAEKGGKIKIYVFTEDLKPAKLSEEVQFDGKFRGSIKMLSIGNSYSIDASTMVHDIAAADGVDINILNLHIGGCTLETHWENAQSGAVAYATQLNGISAGSSSMQSALVKEKWDYVSFQQGSHESNDFSNFWTPEKPYLTNLSEYVNQLAPQATQLIHQTWPYQNQYAISRLGYSGAAPLARNAMFSDVKEAYRQAADKLGVNILPCGEAVQYAQNVKGITETQMYRDNYSHLTEDKGRYLVAAVWYCSLTGNSILTNSFKPAGVSDEEIEKLKQTVDYVVNLEEYKWK